MTVFMLQSRGISVEGTKMIIDDLTAAGFIIVSKSKLVLQQVGQ